MISHHLTVVSLQLFPLRPIGLLLAGHNKEDFQSSACFEFFSKCGRVSSKLSQFLIKLAIIQQRQRHQQIKGHRHNSTNKPQQIKRQYNCNRSSCHS